MILKERKNRLKTHSLDFDPLCVDYLIRIESDVTKSKKKQNKKKNNKRREARLSCDNYFKSDRCSSSMAVQQQETPARVAAIPAN